MLFTERITSLYHELLDDSMEDMTIEVSIPSMHAEILNSLGTLLEEQLQVDVAHWCVNCGCFEYPLTLYKNKYKDQLCPNFWIYN